MKKIILLVMGLFGLLNAATYNVCYGCCRTAVSDFKTGTPTVSISGDTATFSVAQTHELMGPGARVIFGSGPDTVFIAINGKISTSQWRVTTPKGRVPDTAINNTVSGIKHIGTALSSLEITTTGYPLPALLNTKSLVDADVNMYWACYMSSTNYASDSSVFNIDSVAGDSTHRLYIFSPTNTTTECNSAMFPSTAKFDSTKYFIRGTGNCIGKTGVSTAWLKIYNLQLSNIGGNHNASPISILTQSGETCTVEQCITVTQGPDTLITNRTNHGITQITGSAGTLIADNNIIISQTPKGTPLGSGISNVAGTGIFYENTIYGPFKYPINRTAGTVTLSNNFYGGVLNAINGTVTKNYDVYITDESEANGTLTTQTTGQLFSDTTNTNQKFWDYTPKAGSDLIGKGTDLGASYNGDFQHANGSGWRPKTTTWDAGAVEYNPTIAITSIDHITNDRYSISGSGFKPAATCPTVTVGGTSATVDNCTAAIVYITLGGGTARGNDTFSVTNSASDNIKSVAYVYTYPVLSSSTRSYGAHYRIAGSGLKPATDPTITIGGIAAVIDTSWSDSVHLTLGPLTPRGTQNLILTNSDTYKDTLSMTVSIGDHTINFLAMGQSNFMGRDSTTSYVTPSVVAQRWNYTNNTWGVATDPQFSLSNDKFSCLPTLTNLLDNDYRDIGYVFSAYSGSGVITWLDSRDNGNPFNPATIYGATITKVRNAGGIDHMLCWFGENDITNNRSADSVTRSFNHLMAYFKQDLVGYITVPCPIIFIAPHVDSGYVTLTSDSCNQINRDAFRALHRPADSGYYLAGYAVNLPNIDFVHCSEAGQIQAASMFYRGIRYADGVDTYLLGPRFASMAYGKSKDTINITLTKDSPTIAPALGAKNFRVKSGTDTIVINSVAIATNKIKLTLASAITGATQISYLKTSPPARDSLVHYSDSQKTFLEPTSRVFETSYIDTSNIPRVALGHLRIVPTSGDTAGGTSILFYADTLMTGSTCGEVDSYTVLTDSTASGTSKVGTVGNFNIIVHSGAVDSTVVFRYTVPSTGTGSVVIDRKIKTKVGVRVKVGFYKDEEFMEQVEDMKQHF